MANIIAVLMVYVSAGIVEVRIDPPEPVATVEECRAQLNELFRGADYQRIIRAYGEILRVRGECRRETRTTSLVG